MSRNKDILLLLALTLFMCSCNKMLEVGIPASLVSNESAFSDDAIANSVVLGMYSNLLDENGFASGSSKSVTILAGFSSDELSSYNSIVTDDVQFDQNAILPTNNNVLRLWTSCYRSIYDANVIIEGISNSPGISEEMKNQFSGEALFVRAFCYFYLVNLFGEVPLILHSDYRQNSRAPRTAKTAVYQKIIEDLNSAENLLPSDYIGAGRVRVNKASAQAMLARVYLFLTDWERAEANATKVIENFSDYELATDLDRVFLAESKEAIWQLSLPDNNGRSTYEGYQFLILSNGDLNSHKILLRPGFISLFEPNDKRYQNWISNYNSPTGLVYFPYKYKLRSISSVAREYSMVLRLAELYLIRAEARAQRDNLTGSIADLDAIRNRAGLPLIALTDPSISKTDLLLKIEHERQAELFTEWGHRWLDLKRYNRANTVLGPLKSSWNPEDVLYPIPQSELSKNPALAPQTAGY